VVGGWLPGMPAVTFPSTTGIPLASGRALVMQIHYNTLSDGPLPDQSTVELMFADTAPARLADIKLIKDGSFAIPPLSEGYTTTADRVSKTPETVWALIPHMHQFGRQISVEVHRASGGTECLVDIPDWDFNWQQFYFFDSDVGIALEANDRLHLSCSWDNPTATLIRWGEKTEDEMCLTYAYITAGHVE
jgi:hypothetical protein